MSKFLNDVFMSIKICFMQTPNKVAFHLGLYSYFKVPGYVSRVKRGKGTQEGKRSKLLVQVFIYIYTLCMKAAKTLVSLSICTGSHEFSMLKNLIVTKISCTGSYNALTFVCSVD